MPKNLSTKMSKKEFELNLKLLGFTPKDTMGSVKAKYESNTSKISIIELKSKGFFLFTDVMVAAESGLPYAVMIQRILDEQENSL